MRTESERLNKIIEGLLQFAKPKGKKFEKKHGEKIIKNVLELMNYQLNKNNIKQDLNLISMPRILCDVNQIEQVFINIILNAIQAMPKGGQLEIRNKLLIRKSPENMFYEYAAFYFTDTGKGISNSEQKKLFNPFYTTKQKGTGLGLSISFRRFFIICKNFILYGCNFPK